MTLGNFTTLQMAAANATRARVRALEADYIYLLLVQKEVTSQPQAASWIKANGDYTDYQARGGDLPWPYVERSKS